MRLVKLLLSATFILVAQGAATHFGERLVDLPFQSPGQPAATRQGNDIAVQTPRDFPYRTVVSRVATGTVIEIQSMGR